MSNVFTPGPSSVLHPTMRMWHAGMVQPTSYCHESGNQLESRGGYTSMFQFITGSFPSASPCFSPTFTPESSTLVKNTVLFYAGPSQVLFTDPAGIDTRLLTEAWSGGGSIKQQPNWWESSYLYDHAER